MEVFRFFRLHHIYIFAIIPQILPQNELKPGILDLVHKKENACN